ncbi:5618_t:CDS:1, partial [Diversispora eburnea]
VNIKELKRDMLALKNDHARIEKDLEWKSEVRSQGSYYITSLACILRVD